RPVVGDDRDVETPVVAGVDALGPVETIARRGIEQVAGPPRGAVWIGHQVRHAALTRTDGEIEAEAVAVEAASTGLERTHAASLDERRAAEIAAVGEVPQRHVSVPGRAGDGGSNPPCWRSTLPSAPSPPTHSSSP